MTEFFIKGTTFAAPFLSEEVERYVKAKDAATALEDFAASFPKSPGLYAALAYASADDHHKDKEPLARWLSNHEIAKQTATEGKAAYSYLGNGPGDFEIDGERYVIPDPHGGRVVV